MENPHSMSIVMDFLGRPPRFTMGHGTCSGLSRVGAVKLAPWNGHDIVAFTLTRDSALTVSRCCWLRCPRQLTPLCKPAVTDFTAQRMQFPCRCKSRIRRGVSSVAWLRCLMTSNILVGKRKNPEKSRAPVVEWLERSPPTKAIQVRFLAGSGHGFSHVGIVPGRCCMSASFLGDIPFPSPPIPCAAPYPHHSPLIGSQDDREPPKPLNSTRDKPPNNGIVQVRFSHTQVRVTQPKAAVVERLLERSPTTKSSRVRSPAGSLPDFRMWELCMNDSVSPRQLVQAVFGTSWRTLTQSWPSTVAADNQCTVDIVYPQRGRGGWVISTLASHQCEPGSHPRPGYRIFASGNRAGFSRGSPVSSAPAFRCRSIFTSMTLIGSEDLAVKSRPILFTHSILNFVTLFEYNPRKSPRSHPNLFTHSFNSGVLKGKNGAAQECRGWGNGRSLIKPNDSLARFLSAEIRERSLRESNPVHLVGRREFYPLDHRDSSDELKGNGERVSGARSCADWPWDIVRARVAQSRRTDDYTEVHYSPVSLIRVDSKAGQCWDTGTGSEQPARSLYRVFTDKIDFKRVYTDVTFTIGSEFVMHVLDDSEAVADLQGNKKRIPYCQVHSLDDSAPIADLQGNKKRIPYCQMWDNTGATASGQTYEISLRKIREIFIPRRESDKRKQNACLPKNAGEITGVEYGYSIQGAAVAEQLACSSPTKAIRARPGHSGFSHVGIMPEDAVGRRVFSGTSRFPPPLHSGAAPYSPQSPSSALKTLMFKAVPCCSLVSGRNASSFPRLHGGYWLLLRAPRIYSSEQAPVYLATLPHTPLKAPIFRDKQVPLIITPQWRASVSDSATCSSGPRSISETQGGCGSEAELDQRVT
ncbi:hypothetical protein PR048_024409 [Dryococelus australis]|uniref:Uncharacterized protein n=1 Tax=Dryococelus australis TaxID=614101 RepID=A0ABQ9GNJ1_9NEOP|nr:hypothetical protein PR048_024409 [Dryococelus australis]